MKFIEIEVGGAMRIINTAYIKSVWEQSNGSISIQFLEDNCSTYLTTNTFTYDQIKGLLVGQNQKAEEALIEVKECLDSFYDNTKTPSRLYPELKEYAGCINVMSRVCDNALKN